MSTLVNLAVRKVGTACLLISLSSQDTPLYWKKKITFFSQGMTNNLDFSEP